jgi:hypothetical protein
MGTPLRALEGSSRTAYLDSKPRSAPIARATVITAPSISVTSSGDMDEPWLTFSDENSLPAPVAITRPESWGWKGFSDEEIAYGLRVWAGR